jgi:RNA polymerase sigma factor (sigma-70 family)
MSETTPVPIEDLLSHRPWVRRLALSLARDEATAADLEQRTWLAAILHPPRGTASARAWLGRVIRNLARNANRSTGRRRAYERSAHRISADRSTAEIVADAETHRRLVDAVLDLGEPYRSTVLLRFYENLPPRAIARHMGAPVETVRTRVRRALAQLKTRLEGDGGRESWLASLAPLTGLGFETGVTSAGTSGAVIATVTGGAVMSANSTILIAMVLGLIAGFFGGSLSTPRESPAGGKEVATLQRRIAALEAEIGGEESPASGQTLDDDNQEDLNLRVAALEAKLAAKPGAEADEEVLQAERRRLEGLTDEQIMTEAARRTFAARRSRRRPDAEAALGVCEAALARGLTAEQRAKILLERGRCLRQMGDRAREEASFREALELADGSSREWRHAAHELAMTAAGRKDLRAAADWFLRIAEQPGSPQIDQAGYRSLAAGYFSKMGETERARAEYGRVIEEFSGAEDNRVKRTVSNCRGAIKRLDRAADGR